MKGRHMLILAAIIAVSQAVFSATDPYEATTEKQSQYDDKCFHCIKMGNLFCSVDGHLGKCMPATCKEQLLEGADQKAARGKCTLMNHSCDDAENETSPRKQVITSYSQCKDPLPLQVRCPSSFNERITQFEINEGGLLTVDSASQNEELIRVPFQLKFLVPKFDICMATIQLDRVTDGSTVKKGAFSFIERNDDIAISLIKMKKGQNPIEENLTINSANVFNYGSYLDKGGFGGRVPVDNQTEWLAIMINFNKKESRQVILEYGAGVQSFVACTTTILAYLVLAYTF